MNISPKTVAALKERGLDIIRVSEVLPANASDEVVLDLARREERTLITQDLDFSSLLVLGGHERPSLITLRLSCSDPKSVEERLLEILPGLEGALQGGAAVTIEDVAVRVRALPLE